VIHHAHPNLDGQFEIGQRAVRHLGVVPDPHPMGDLLGGGQVGDERPRDTEAVGDDAPDVDGGVPEPLDGAHYL